MDVEIKIDNKCKSPKIVIYTDKITPSINDLVKKLSGETYELEEMFEGTPFIRISNSEIVNFKYVESLDMSMSGTISIKLKTGGNSFVSRRYVNKIKEYLGL